jgi:hypothetical protein
MFTIVNDDFSIGVTEGVPPAVIARVGEPVDYTVLWTHPDRWCLLNTIGVRISDEEGEALSIHFDEADNTFSRFDLNTENLLRPSALGQQMRFETPAAVMYLENSEVIGSGPTGPSVLLKLNLRFKPHAAGRISKPRRLPWMTSAPGKALIRSGRSRCSRDDGSRLMVRDS